MLSDYVIQCGVILQLVPPAATAPVPEPLAINPPAVIQRVDYEVADEDPQLDERTIRQLLDVRRAVGIGALPDNSAADFEDALRSEFGATQHSTSATAIEQQSTVELLRATAERLDETANQLERMDNYPAADDLRRLAQRLRLHSRSLNR